MAKAAGKEWQWRSGGPRPPVEAEVFAAELERLADGDALELVEPDVIWQAARKRSSPIHPCFNWNLQEAAEAHWTDRARQLVGSLQMVRVDVEHSTATSTRGWWSVSVDNRRGYAKQERVMSDRDLRLQLLAGVKRDVMQVLAKYFHILSFGRVVPKLQEIVDEIADEIDGLESAAKARRPRPGTAPEVETHPT